MGIVFSWLMTAVSFSNSFEKELSKSSLTIPSSWLKFWLNEGREKLPTT